MINWIPIGKVFQPSQDTESLSARRKELIDRIGRGLVDAQSFRSRTSHSKFRKEDDLEIFCAVGSRLILDECPFPLSEEFSRDDTDKPTEVASYNLALSLSPLQTTADWLTERRNTSTIIQKRADWETGHFHSRMLSYIDRQHGDDGIGFQYLSHDLFAVEVDAESVKRILGWEAGKQNTVTARGTQYDWEAAFADVAARFYHDEEFEDVNARGVQADVIKMLQDAFDARGLAVPTADTCKPKARKIVGALRGKKP